MDWFKKMIKDNIDVVLTVSLGLAAIAIYKLFFEPGGLFESFTKEILGLGMQMIKNAFGMGE